MQWAGGPELVSGTKESMATKKPVANKDYPISKNQSSRPNKKNKNQIKIKPRVLVPQVSLLGFANKLFKAGKLSGTKG